MNLFLMDASRTFMSSLDTESHPGPISRGPRDVGALEEKWGLDLGPGGRDSGRPSLLLWGCAKRNVDLSPRSAGTAVFQV